VERLGVQLEEKLEKKKEEVEFGREVGGEESETSHRSWKQTKENVKKRTKERERTRETHSRKDMKPEADRDDELAGGGATYSLCVAQTPYNIDKCRLGKHDKKPNRTEG
jgi:hypothetical protein